MKEPKNQQGLSLIEVLIAITIFAILGAIISSSLILTVQGTKKSESQIRVRENLNYAVTVIERNLRNASRIDTCPTSGTATVLNYQDQYGVPTSFSCLDIGGVGGRLASGSSRLTSNAVKLTKCTFICEYPAGTAKPAMVTVDVTAVDASASGKVGATVSTQSIIYLRN